MKPKQKLVWIMNFYAKTTLSQDTINDFVKEVETIRDEVMGKVKKYSVIDNKRTRFMEDTRSKPQTELGLRIRFWNLTETHKVEFRDFDLEFISERWCVLFKEAK